MAVFLFELLSMEAAAFEDDFWECQAGVPWGLIG